MQGNTAGLGCWCLLIFCFFGSVDLKESTPLLVHVLYRHGDRSPIRTFPTDIHQEDDWPQGFGQLSTTGMKQEYELGEFLRKRYDGFLKSNYDHREIYVRSTDIDRTLMSAQAVLAGLYPPSGEQIWDKNIAWQPIPVHTIDYDKDPMIHAGIPCHAYNQLYSDVYQSKEVLRFQQENKEFLDMLREKSGLKDATLYDIMETIPDALFCEKNANKTWNSWVTNDIFEKIWELKLLKFKLYFYTPEMTRFQSGVFLYTLVNQTQEYFEGSNKDGPKMFMYSSHDSTLAAILSGLGVWGGEVPPYSSCIMFELHQKAPHQYNMQIWYRNGSTKDHTAEPTLLQLDDCEAECEISQFYHLLEPMTIPGVDAWFKECKGEKHESHFNGRTVAIILCAVAVIVIFGIIFLMCYRRKKDYPYHFANFNEPPDA